MTTMYRRKTLKRRIWSFCDDCSWWYEKNRQGLIGGFMLGVLSMCIVAEIVWGL